MQLFHDDCFNVFPLLADKSVDLVLCDMPYGTTACKWDTVIDLERMWLELKRITKDRVSFIFTASQPFTSILINSNLNIFKYSWVWHKTNSGGGFFNANYQPIKKHEDIVIFSYLNASTGSVNNMIYNPQELIKCNQIGRKIRRYSETVGDRPCRAKEYIQKFKNYPISILQFDNDNNKFHPTQKPVALMEYLIKTYSNEGDTVLDFCMGSGTTGVACKTLNRNFIGIEKEKEYFDIAVKRIGL